MVYMAALKHDRRHGVSRTQPPQTEEITAAEIQILLTRNCKTRHVNSFSEIAQTDFADKNIYYLALPTSGKTKKHKTKKIRELYIKKCINRKLRTHNRLNLWPSAHFCEAEMESPPYPFMCACTHTWVPIDRKTSRRPEKSFLPNM